MYRLFMVILAMMPVVAFAQLYDDKFERALAACKKEMDDPRLSILKGKIALPDEPYTVELLKIARKPTPDEQAALRALIELHKKCADVHLGLVGVQSRPEHLALAEGRSTFSEYSLNEIVRVYNLSLESKQKMAQVDAEEKNRKAQFASQILQLNCQMTAPAINDLQQRIPSRDETIKIDYPNFTANGFTANFTESEIRWDDDKNILNRLSGSYSRGKFPIFMLGRCSKAEKQF